MEVPMTHPGHRLKHQFMTPLGLNANQLAIGLDVHRSTVARLLAGNLPLSPSIAAKLGAYFRVPAKWFLVMQAEYDADRIAADASLIANVIPLTMHPDHLITPDGVLSLLSTTPNPTPTPAVRAVTLHNGAVALLSNTP